MTQDVDWKSWRKAERERLIAERLAMSGEARQEIGSHVCAKLDGILSLPPGGIVSFYWPFRGELNLRSWIVGLLERGFRSALPVVTEKKATMEFRLWNPQTRMERGIWNIPVPANADSVVPDVIIAPLVGFDRSGFRLGYGGGYFDRTLATFPTQPLTIGVGYSASELPSIHPQRHDIPMRLIVTESVMLERDPACQPRAVQNAAAVPVRLPRIAVSQLPRAYRHPTPEENAASQAEQPIPSTPADIS